MDYVQKFLFGFYPYIAIGVFIMGCLMRYNYAQYGWKSGSSQLLSTRWMRIGSNFFHVGVILLLLGHCVGLLTPESIYTRFITVHQKQLLAMTAGGIFGTICFIGLTILVCRRLFNQRVRATSTKLDIFILLLIYLQLILGLLTIPDSYRHAGGRTMEALAYWAQHIITMRLDAAHFIVGLPLIFQLHILVGLTILLIFPFTRLVHVLSAPIWYLGRTGYQIVRKKEGKPQKKIS